MNRAKFFELLLDGLVEAANSSALDSWETLRRVLAPLISLGELREILVYRQHRGDFTLLGHIGPDESNLRFSVFDAAVAGIRGTRVCELPGQDGKAAGLLVLVPRPGRKISAYLCERLAKVVGSILSGGRTSGPREERIERSLRGVLEQLVSSPNPVDALRPLLLEMIAQVNSHGGGLFVYHAATHTLRMVELVSYRRPPTDLQQPEFDSFTHAVPADITPYWKRLLEERGPVVLNATSACDEIYFWPGTREWHLTQNEPLAAGFPLILGDRPLGFIGLTFPLEADVSSSMFEVAAPFAQEATLALGLIELGEQARADLRQRQDEDLARMNRTIERGLAAVETELDQEGVVGNLLRVVSEHLDSKSAALWLYDEAARRFSVKLAFMEGAVVSDPLQVASRWPRGRDLLWRRHIDERRPVVYPVAELEPEAEQAFFLDMGVKTLLGIPLLCGRDVVGAFTMRFPDEREFSSADLQLVQILSHQATLAILLTRLLDRVKELAVLGERTRLAGEMHDTVGQDLAALLAHTQAAQVYLTPPDTALIKAGDHLRKVERLARKSLLETRRSLENLHPLALERTSLRKALEKLLSRLAKSGLLNCNFRLQGPPQALPKDVEAEIYRIMQEGVNNAVIHSGASSLSLTLQYEKNAIKLLLSDDGNGNWTEIDSSGHGLKLMQERALRIGAELAYQRVAGVGTEVSVSWPGLS